MANLMWLVLMYTCFFTFCFLKYLLSAELLNLGKIHYLESKKCLNVELLDFVGFLVFFTYYIHMLFLFHLENAS